MQRRGFTSTPVLEASKATASETKQEKDPRGPQQRRPPSSSTPSDESLLGIVHSIVEQHPDSYAKKAAESRPEKVKSSSNAVAGKSTNATGTGPTGTATSGVPEKDSTLGTAPASASSPTPNGERKTNRLEGSSLGESFPLSSDVFVLNPRPHLQSFPFLLPSLWAAEVPKRLLNLFSPELIKLNRPSVYSQAFIHPSFSNSKENSMVALEPLGRALIEACLKDAIVGGDDGCLGALRELADRRISGDISPPTASGSATPEQFRAAHERFVKDIDLFRKAHHAILNETTLTVISRSIWNTSDLILTDAGIHALQSLYSLTSIRGTTTSKGRSAEGVALPQGAAASSVLALVGAVYVDGGLLTATKFASRHVLAPALAIIPDTSLA